ncbi:MAG: response regulator [Phycisphaerales bacterium]|nr:response regulator [Phycisphaerales bacterium]
MSFVRTFQLADQSRSSLLERVEEVERQMASANRRGAQRVAFRVRDIRMVVTQPGGGVSRFLVDGKDLGPSGMCVLHGGFIHPGSKVGVLLPRPSGGEEQALGRVAWCAAAEGRIHLVGIEFNNPLDLRLFARASDSAADAGDAPDVSDLRGSVLLVDEQPTACDLVKFHLRPSQVQLSVAHNRAGAVLLASRRGPDALIVEASVGPDRAEDIVADIRAGGFSGPVAVITAETSRARIAELKAIGPAGVLIKPFQPAALTRLLRAMLAAPGEAPAPAPVDHSSPILSTLAEAPDMRPLVRQFVEHARAMMATLDPDATSDLPDVRKACLTLRGGGTSYGFPAVTEAADTAVKALDASASVEESVPALAALRAVIARIRPPED